MRIETVRFKRTQTVQKSEGWERGVMIDPRIKDGSIRIYDMNGKYVRDPYTWYEDHDHVMSIDILPSDNHLKD